MKNIIKKLESTAALIVFAAGFGQCIAVSLAVFCFTWFVIPELALLFVFVYAILFIPIMLFGVLLTWRLIRSKKVSNRFLRAAYKTVTIILVWFIAFFPFSGFGGQALLNMPDTIARNQDAAAFRETILTAETYADLTPFGFGNYKRVNADDYYLWDITMPKDYPDSYKGVYLVYERFEIQTTFDYGNRAKDIMYDVYFYEGTYIITIPASEKILYLCKEISRDAELFRVAVYNQLVSVNTEKLRELPSERYSRKELIDMLGKGEKDAEIIGRQEIIKNAETFADLTIFGLGVYKRVNEGDKYLWDITQSKELPIHDDTFLFEYCRNERDRDTWDDLNKNRDVLYKVCYYEGTYIIIPLTNYNYAYLCKALDWDTDLFYMSTIGPEAKEKILELPGNHYSWTEIAGKLGKYRQ